MMNQGYGYGGGMSSGFGLSEILFLVFGALVVAGIVVLIVWAVRSSHGQGTTTTGSGATAGPSVGHDEAVAIARRRLATGEITKEQYDEIMTALGG
ncbi:MAG: hypothetical protein CVT59_03020 [Actinobacteria bacterium HGW-Actinobacteria-1]|jgi:uncharacterized membrane protein|nr:MAG: hypothetical protein CVT59_03020 [Actinobacteria bacterium HGW-Actinobacteria-1]